MSLDPIKQALLASYESHGGINHFDGTGNIFVADSGNAAVRRIAADGTVTTLPLAPAASNTPPPPAGGGTPPPMGMSGGGGGGAMEPWWILSLALLIAARAMTRRRLRRLPAR